jgi:thioredoxin-related protein
MSIAFRIALLCLLWGYSVITATAATPAPDSLQWHTLEAGIRQAEETDTKILLAVHTDWCTYCRAMEEVTYADSAVITFINQHFILIRLNPETGETAQVGARQVTARGLAQSLDIRSYPTTIFLNPDLSAIAGHPGFVDAAMFLKIMLYVDADLVGVQEFSEYLEVETTDN